MREGRCTSTLRTHSYIQQHPEVLVCMLDCCASTRQCVWGNTVLQSISKQVRNKMGRVTNQLLQICIRGGDHSTWLTTGACTVSMARANLLGRDVLMV